MASGSHTIRAEAVDSSGNASGKSIQVNVGSGGDKGSTGRKQFITALPPMCATGAGDRILSFSHGVARIFSQHFQG